ncbi:MAG TPA: NAD(+) diphosphatase [Beijerinckiaceae bacterium]|jgi:NAD+ diphosphatase
MIDLDRLGFARSLLDRHGAERSDAAYTAALDDPNAAIVLVAGDTPVLQALGEGASAFLDRSALARLPQRAETVLLGTADGRPVLAVLAAPEAAALYAEDSAFQVLDLRSVAVQGAVPAPELGALATAKSILSWHARHRFCANCGSATQPAASGFRRDCGACGTQHFPRTDPVAIMLVTRGDCCLLGRQPRFVAGSYSCLAGFIEPGETLEDAVRREVQEEAGVTCGAVSYLVSQPWPFPSSLMIGCQAEALTEDITIDREELEDARWFPRDEVRLMLERRHPDGLICPPPVAIAHHLVRHWVEAGG